MSTIAIIAALEREFAPLVSRWPMRRFTYSGRHFRAYECGDTVAVAGGIGVKAAGMAAHALVAQYHPRMLISAGVAGALQKDLAVGAVITPKIVIDFATGIEYEAKVGDGALVTIAQIAGRKLKEEIAALFQASAVDMEAAAVAEVARQEGAAFRCIKAISDQADFAMPPVNEFLDDQGRFRTLKFAAWAAVRPSRWPEVAALARQTRRATNALCECLRDIAGP